MAYGIKTASDILRRAAIGTRTAAGQITSRLGYHTRPGLMLLGAQKSGTSAVATYLRRHPQVRWAAKKELNFFNQERAFRKGLASYHARFPMPFEVSKDTLLIDGTSGNLYSHEAPQRIHAYDPEIKLVVTVRDPVKRAYSQWNMYRDLGRTRGGRRDLATLMGRLEPASAGWARRILENGVPPFPDAVEEEVGMLNDPGAPAEPSFIRRGLYLDQIERYLAWFPRSQLLVLEAGDLRRDPAAVMQQVASFAGLEPFDWSTQPLGTVHARPYREQMDPATEARLSALFEEPNRRLGEYLGRKLDWS